MWFTISGGEPFLRFDIVDICEMAYKFCSPRIINIPTNCLSPYLIEGKSRLILERCPDVDLIVNLSLDGVKEKHDNIRGVHGNFDRFLDTFGRLNKLKKEFPKLNVGIHSVISRYNIDDVFELYEFVKGLEPDSYISEIAENRAELFNMDAEIAPDPVLYAKVINIFSQMVIEDFLKMKGFIQRATQAFRVVYYRKLSESPRVFKQMIPCYASYASCHITPYGDVWPCCVLGYNEPMGNLRDVDYDFDKVWRSEIAKNIRMRVKNGGCGCPLANVHYTNILCNYHEILNVLLLFLKPGYK